MLNSIAALYGTGAVASTTAYESIATITVGSGGASYAEFTAIPSTYSHLQLRIMAKDTLADVASLPTMQLGNSTIDTGANYSYHTLIGNGGSAFAGAGTSTTSMQIGIDTATWSSTTNIFGVFIIDLLDYANTNKYKTIRSLSGNDFNSGNADSQIRLTSGNWRSTSAVDRIKITPATGFAQYSSFALYGVK